MAVKASTQITISKVIDIYACYRYYKLQSSTLAKPDKPTTNPPSGWSDTEPAYVSGSTNTLYFVDCNVYSDKSFSFSEVSKSSSYEAAKDAWNKANNAQNTVDNLEIGGRNLARKTSSEWTNWWVPTANKVNVCTWLSDIYPGSIKVGDIFTVSFDIDIKKFTKSVDGNLNVFIQGPVDGGWTIYNPFGRYNITNKITSNDCTEHITYIAKIVSEAQVSSTKFGFGIRCDYSDGTGKLRLKNIKVERGNKATDWTPAPEDNIAKVDVEYYLSTSATSLSGGSWSTTAPTWVNGKYMWSRTVTVDGAGNKTYSPNQNGVCIAGAKGNTGSTGASGKGVSSIVEQYYKSTSATSLVGGSWGTTYPGWESGKYIWTKSVITYTDKTTTTTTAVCVTGDTGDSFNWNLVPNSYKMNDQTHQGIGGYATTVSVVADSDALCGYHMELKCTKAGTGPYFSVFPKTDDKVGKIYSLSFEAKCSVAKTNNVRLGHESGGLMNGQSLTTEWKRFTKTWTFTDKAGAIVIYSSFAVDEILYIRDFKIEEGNVATKWAPAQIDLKGETGKNALQPTRNWIGTFTTIGVTTTTSASKDFNRTPIVGDTFTNLDSSSNTGTWQVISINGDNVTIKLLSYVNSKGSKGDTGASGKSIGSVTNYYLATSLSTGVSTSTSGWTTTVQNVTTDKKYLWNYEVIKYTDNTVASTTTPCVIGAYGNTGNTGATGKGISKVTEHYAVSTSNTTVPTSWSNTVPTMTTTNKYLWNYETITYTDNTTSDTTKRVIGVYGNTGATGKGIKSASVTYQSSTSGTSIPTGTWATSIPSVSAGSFLWTRTVVTYTDSSTTTSYSVGKMGNTGATGKGVKSTVITYQSSTSGTTVPTGTWQASIPTVSAGSYLWTRTVITYTDNTTSTSYSIGKMGEKGDKGDKGDPGTAGKDAIIISATAPTSPKTGQLWQTASGEPIKRWDGSKWVLHYISVENLDVQKLSAIAADLGTVTAGVIKNKSGTVEVDVERGYIETWNDNTRQSSKLFSGIVAVSARDSIDNEVNAYLQYDGLHIHETNNLYGYSVCMSDNGDDLIAAKILDNGDRREYVSLFNNLKRIPIAGTKVVTITKGTNYVKLMTASEAADILGIANGNSGYVSLSVSNGDAKAFNARPYSAEYWSSDASWYVYFNAAAAITQPVRINYILAPII